jgi:hypothetical protein
MHLYITSNDSAGNQNYTMVNFTIQEYTGPESSGGPSVTPTTSGNYSLNLTATQRDALCSRLNSAFVNYSSNFSAYPVSVRDSIRNDIAIALGRGVSNMILKYYIENFEKECPNYINRPLSIVPEEESEEPINYTAVFIIIGAILFIVILILADRMFLHMVHISKNKRDEVYGRRE